MNILCSPFIIINYFNEVYFNRLFHKYEINLERYHQYNRQKNKYSYPSNLIITPFSLKIGTLNYLVFSSYLFIKSLACINK